MCRDLVDLAPLGWVGGLGQAQPLGWSQYQYLTYVVQIKSFSPPAAPRTPHPAVRQRRGGAHTCQHVVLVQRTAHYTQTQSLTPQAPPLTLPQLARATPTSTLPPQLSPPSFTPPTYITYLSPPLPTAPCLPSYIPVPQPAATPLRPTRTLSFGCHSVSHLSHLSLTLAASAALR